MITIDLNPEETENKAVFYASVYQDGCIVHVDVSERPQGCTFKILTTSFYPGGNDQWHQNLASEIRSLLTKAEAIITDEYGQQDLKPKLITQKTLDKVLANATTQ